MDVSAVMDVALMILMGVGSTLIALWAGLTLGNWVWRRINNDR